VQVQPELISLDALRQQLEAVLPDENRSLGIPPACYADDGLRAMEQRAVFHHGWLTLGRADRWPDVGDYSALEIGGVPLIVLRNNLGELKAFANSCRHRGSQMLTGDGNCKKIKCPFHWWTYDLDGRLKVYSRMENAVDFNPDSINWLYPEPDAVDTVDGQFTTQFGATEGAAALLEDAQQYALPIANGLQGRSAKGTRYTWIYPNTTFALAQDSMWMYQAFPLSADRCRVMQTICFPAESVALSDFDDRVSHYYARIDAALKEDLPFLRQQQVGLNSMFARQGRFAALEPSVSKFAYWYAQRLLMHLTDR
jgi:phenylpropionate dioxygenase-like ring-hydroxylating dioxygenase large terminal subunit